jgi:hypothetical protein
MNNQEFTEKEAKNYLKEKEALIKTIKYIKLLDEESINIIISLAKQRKIILKK